jgi:hypothetical protein
VTAIPSEPLGGLTVWKRADVERRGDWKHVLTPAEGAVASDAAAIAAADTSD